MQFINSLEFARQLDEKDILKKFRQQFLFPKINGHDAIYFCGNSLGLQPLNTKKQIEQELNDWADLAVEAHFNAIHPWFSYHEILTESLAKLAGAKPMEVVAMNTLTTNLHLLLVSFYRPTKERF